MKNIIFKRATICNFYSIGDEPVVIEFKPGLHIITGVNHDKADRQNAIGKSSIINTVFYGIFGESLDEIKKDLIPNNVTNKTAEVIIDIDVHTDSKIETVQIIRTIAPSRCQVFINGIDETLDTISNTNALINGKLCCTPQIFQNCVTLTINNTIPFMGKKKSDKKKFIEDVLSLEVFSQIVDLIKKDITAKQRILDQEAVKFQELNRNISNLNKQKDTAISEQKMKIEKYQNRKDSNAKEIALLTEKLANFVIIDCLQAEEQIKTNQLTFQQLDSKLREVRDSISTNNTLINQTKQKKDRAGTLEDTCPVCFKAVDFADHTHIQEEKDRLQEDIEKFERDNLELKQKEGQILAGIGKVTLKNTQLTASINDFKINVKEKENIATRLIQLKQWQTELDGDLAELANTAFSFDSLILEQQNRLDVVAEAIEDFKQEMHVFNIAKFVASEEGVKSYIVKKILELFNSKLLYYLKKMDANCVCSFNEYFEDEIVDDKGKIISYFNLSGAERKNVDFACLFTFMDIRRLQGDVSFNFSIFDELFDTSFDEKGIELAINLIKERVDKFQECIMVISHRKESIKAATGDVIFLEKTGGITKRVEYKDGF